MKLTDEQINRMKKVLEKSTPAPWRVEKEMMEEEGYEKYIKSIRIMAKGNSVVTQMNWNNPVEENAYLIANAPKWIKQLIDDRQAWKEEVEELKEENQRLADNYNRDVYSADTEIIKLQNQLNQAVEVIERVLRFAKENSDDSRYLEQVQAELEHFLSQEGGKP